MMAGVQAQPLPKSVVIIGAGAAGLSAAIEAKKMGSTVTLIDKQPKIGGNSMKASSGINACSSSVQEALNVSDSCDIFRKDTLQAGGGYNDPLLVDKLVRESSDAITFLIDHGLSLGGLIQCGGHSVSRTHRLTTNAPIGFSLVTTLSKALAEDITVLTSTEAVSLDWETDASSGHRKVSGVHIRSTSAETSTFLPASAVVVTSGGAACDRDEDPKSGLMAAFAPHLRGMATSSGPQADGHGVRILREAGASLINMNHVQVHPTGMINPASPSDLTKFLAPEALRGSGGILVNERGVRFANELGRRGYLTEQIQQHCAPHPEKLQSGREQPVAYLLLNADAISKFGSTAGFYQSKGLMMEYENAEKFCTSTGIPLDALENTFVQYNQAATASSSSSQKADVSISSPSAAATATAAAAAVVDAASGSVANLATGTPASSSASASASGNAVGAEDPFGKTVFPTGASFDATEKLWVVLVTPVIHYYIGGVKIDASTNVKMAFEEGDAEKPILGLFAAGECTGGVHGHDRLAGNSLLECVVFGRTAGQSAAQYVLQQQQQQQQQQQATPTTTAG